MSRHAAPESRLKTDPDLATTARIIVRRESGEGLPVLTVAERLAYVGKHRREIPAR